MNASNTEFRVKVLSIIPDPTSKECLELLEKEKIEIGSNTFEAGWYAALAFIQKELYKTF